MTIDVQLFVSASVSVRAGDSTDMIADDSDDCSALGFGKLCIMAPSCIVGDAFPLRALNFDGGGTGRFADAGTLALRFAAN